MTSNNDDLKEALQQNLKLRRELGAEVAKASASDSNAKRIADVHATPHNRPPKLTSADARQATGARAMLWVLIGSVSLAVIAGFALGLVFGWIPLPSSVVP